MPKKVSIGIDLGTTKCCVGVVRDGKVEIIDNERSKKTTPSYVAFTETERLVGEDAKDQAVLNPANTVFGMKKLLGQTFDSPEVQRYVPGTLPFRVSADDGTANPVIHVTYKEKEIRLLPEQVTAMLLSKMKELVETSLDCEVEEAVISVPASFTNAQRQATKDAATIAGLKVRALVNETTAAAVAYQANRKRGSIETIAVVDFGGGKLDVSVVTVKKDAVEVEATFGSSLIGGTDIDDQLVRILMNKFKLTHNIDLSSNSKAKERLRGLCVKLKHTLSLLPESRVQLDNLDENKDLDVIITREEFENDVGRRIRKVFTRVVQRVLSDTLVQGLPISKVLLVGGTTRIPMVQKLLREHFRLLDRSVNPDEAVAQGAALMTTFSKDRVHDVTLHAFYLKIGTERHLLFEKYTSIPDSRAVELPVWRGHANSLVEWQYKLGGSCGNVLAQYICGVPSQKKIKFNFLVDRCGIFQATARLGIDAVSNCLQLVSKQNMQEMINLEKSFRFDSIKEHSRISALSDLESYCFAEKSHLEAQFRQQKLPKTTYEVISQKLMDIITWIDCSPNATKQDYEGKKVELEKLGNAHLFHNKGTLPDMKNKTGSASRALWSQTDNKVTRRDEKVSGQDTSFTLTDQKMEVETDPRSDIESKMEISEVQLLKKHPDDGETLHVVCRAKRARMEPEDQETQQKIDFLPTGAWETSERNHIPTDGWKVVTSYGSDAPCGIFNRSSFRDYHNESQARGDHPRSSSTNLQICERVLHCAMSTVLQELEHQGYVLDGGEREEFMTNCRDGLALEKENESHSVNRNSLEAKLEADIDDRVNAFADVLRKRLKKMILNVDDRLASSKSGSQKNSC